jgi:transcriptional regulator with XRE-family HTH domain
MYETPSLPPEDVRRVRRLLGETQVRFAKRLGVDPVTVARWETGQRRCTGAYADAIAALDAKHGGKTEPAASSTHTATVSALAGLVRSLFQGSTTQAVSAILDHETLSDKDLDQLAALIEAKRRKKGKR